MFLIITSAKIPSNRSAFVILFFGALLSIYSLTVYSQDTTRAEIVGSTDIKDASKLYKGSYALIIGASNYQNKGTWKPLGGVLEDIPAIENALKTQGFEITKVLDPTAAQLRTAFESFISKYGREQNNRLLFYFAGHGNTIPNTYGGEMGYILPIDAPKASDENFTSYAMPMKQIEIYAEQISSKHALFVFDSCFSGSIFDSTPQRGNVSTLILNKVEKPVRQFLTSGSASETVPDKSKFRARFIAAINGEADANQDGFVTGSELGVFIEQLANDPDTPTRPQFGKSRNQYLKDGDFIFILPNTTRSVKKVTAAVESEYQIPETLRQAIDLLGGLSGKTDKARAKQLFIDTSSRGDALATMWIARNYSLGNCNFQQNEDNAQKIAKTVISQVKELAEKGNDEAMFLLGDAYLSGLGIEKDFSQAVIWTRKAISKGNSFAMNNLGYMYYHGEGVPKDTAQALSLYTLAAEKGFSTAINNIGGMYKDGKVVPKDYAMALSFFNKAAERGGMFGMYNLGDMYLNGYGVPKDAAQAVNWYVKAAENGHSYSLLVLARLYRDGTEIKRDMAQAVKWYEKSAQTGDADAISELAFLYLDGAEGMTKDASQVIPLFRKLADEGIASGLTFLGWAYENGKGVAVDPLRASIYYQQAADKGDKFSMTRLGKFYYDGKYVPQDFAKAEKYYRQTLGAGFPQAEVGLGEMYERGKGVAQNYQQAIGLYTKIAYPTGTFLNMDVQAGNSLAQFSLGRVYESDSEIRDYAQSIRWYRRAAFQGNKEAMERLAVLYETGKGAEKNLQLAEMWRKNAKSSAKRFTVPYDLNGEKTPFYVIILEEYPIDEDNPIREENERILLEHNAKAPAEVTDSFKKLLKIARDNKVSFTELCVYALGAANEKGKEETKK